MLHTDSFWDTQSEIHPSQTGGLSALVLQSSNMGTLLTLNVI